MLSDMTRVKYNKKKGWKEQRLAELNRRKMPSKPNAEFNKDQFLKLYGNKD